MNSVIIHITEDNQLLNKAAVRKFFDAMRPGKGLLTYKSLNKRSLPTNSYIHVLFTMLVDPLRDAGWDNIRTPEDAKEFVKRLFLTVKITNEKTGEEMDYVRHTSELTQEESNVFIEDLKKWSSEYLGVVLPDPGESVPMFATYDNEFNLTIVR